MKLFKLAGEDDSMKMPLDELNEEMDFETKDIINILTIQVGEVCNCEDGIQVVRVA